MFLNYIALMMRLARIGKVELSGVRELVKKILQDESKVKAIQYYLALYPEALQEALKGYYFMVRREV
jgi:cell division septal protein FtsQ